nr:uncharacterized protein LOC115104004 isoform X2 [Oncorhynchus nerka]
MSLNITVKSEDSESFDEEDESSPLLSVKRGSESAARHDISPGEGGPIEDHAGYSTQHGRLATKTTSKPIVLYGKTILKIALAPVMTLPTPRPPPQVSPEFSYQAIVYLIDAVGRRWSLYGTRERSQLFQSVQKELEEQGHCLPVEKIRRKWNNLIVTYKRVKYRGRETGQARTSWEYFEQKRGESTSLLQESLRRQEGHAEEEQVCRSRAEAQGRRSERREVCMAESLGRMATALELLSSKQDTVIPLLQRLAERDGK